MQPCDPPGTSEKDSTPVKYIFYDFESDQSSGTHKPNLVVARWTCTNCLDTPIDTPDGEDMLRR